MLSAVTYVPVLARDHLGISELMITFIVGAYATASFIASYLFGRAGDIYGRRVIIRLGLLLSTLSFALLLVSSTFEILLIVRIANGFCIGIYPGALAAYAYESKMKMGRFATWGAIGWAIGTFFAGYAAGFNIYYAFVMSTIFLIFAFSSSLTLPKVSRIRVNVPLFPVETFKKNIHVYLAMLLRHSSAAAIWTLWPLFLISIGATPLTIAIVQVTNSIAQVLFMVALTDRLESKTLVALGLIGSAITFASFPLARNVLEVLPSQVLLGFSWACLYVGSLKYVTDNNDDRSTASGLLTSIMSLSGAIGPIFAAVIYSIIPGYVPIMFFAVFMSILSFAIFWYNTHKKSYIESLLKPDSFLLDSE